MPGWILQSQNDIPTILRLPPGSVRTVGRTARADFILDAALVSRVHCRLTADKSDQLIVEDLGSTNGTIVNGKAVPRAVLREGDTLTIGRVVFDVRGAGAGAGAGEAASPDHEPATAEAGTPGAQAKEA